MEAVAKLKNNRRSPRKVRLVADLVRGKKVEDALNILKFAKQHASLDLEKVILSAIANWENANEDSASDVSDLYIKSIMVDQGRSLKRFRPAPFGRPHRIRKRSNHITIVVDSKEQSDNNSAE